MERRSDPLIGRQLGSYQIRSVLGEGGMARVYRAFQARLRREVALKVISATVASQTDFSARFEREAQLIASLEHPHIVSVYDFGEEGNFTYLVMQYVSGGTLRDQLRQGQPIEPLWAAQYTVQMARALHHAHLRGIVHRDVKPQNMLVSATDANQLLLSDFGIAKLFDSTQEDTWTGSAPGSIPMNPTLTSADQIVGTAEYMAPEQIHKRLLDARTDVYALGVVLYQMLTGQTPFKSTTAIGLMYQHINTPPPPMRSINPSVPDVLAHITAKALEKVPEARFPSAEAMAQAIEAAMPSPAHRASAKALEISSSIPNSTSQGEISTLGPQIQTPIRRSEQTKPATMSHHPIDSSRSAGKIASPRVRKSFYVPTMSVIVLIVLAILIIAPRVLPSLETIPPDTSAQARSFTDTFSDNHNNWIQGDTGGLTASIENGKYMLTTDSQVVTHFPYPRASGTLPEEFTLLTEMAYDQGTTSIVYGLTFHMTHDGNAVKCYAFVINNKGAYQLLRYDGTAKAVTLWQGQSSAIANQSGQKNILQTIVKEGKFRFTINGQPVPLKANETTITDNVYTGGQIGLLIAGQEAIFTVTKVQLTVP